MQSVSFYVLSIPCKFVFSFSKNYKSCFSGHFLWHPYGVSLVAQQYRNLPEMQEMLLEPQVRSLGLEDALEKRWQPTPVLLPGKSPGQRNLAGYGPWRHKRVGCDLAMKKKKKIRFLWHLHVLKLKFPFLLLLLKQTWVCSPECNKANLLTPCYGKGKYAICICIVKAPIQGGWVAYAQQPLTPSGLSERSFIGRIWGKGCRVCDSHWLVAMLQESCAQPEVTILHLRWGT